MDPIQLLAPWVRAGRIEPAASSSRAVDGPQSSGGNRWLASGFTSQGVSASPTVTRAHDAWMTHVLGPAGDVVPAAWVADDQALRFERVHCVLRGVVGDAVLL